MATIRCLEDLLEAGKLKSGDIVYFDTLKYVPITGNHLECKGYGDDEIFKRFLINKTALAELAYGYSPYDSVWPGSEVFDYAALTRLVALLYCELEIITKKGVEPEIEIIIKINGKEIPFFREKGK
jgi:hypothetical protein